MNTHSRRTLLHTTAWSVPAVALVSAAPAYAASVASSVRFDVLQTGDGRADIVVTNLTTEPVSVVVLLPLQQTEAFLSSISTDGSWNGQFSGMDFVATVTVDPMSEAGYLGFSWDLMSGDGLYTWTMTAGSDAPVAASLPWADPSSTLRRSAPAPMPSDVRHYTVPR